MVEKLSSRITTSALSFATCVKQFTESGSKYLCSGTYSDHGGYRRAYFQGEKEPPSPNTHIKWQPQPVEDISPLHMFILLNCYQKLH